MPERVVVGMTLQPDAAEYLRANFPAGHELRIRPAHDVLDDDLAWATVLCVFHVSPTRIASFRNLRWLHVPAVGVGHFAELNVTRPDLRLTATGPFNARAVAEHGLGLLLALRRGLTWIIEGRAQHTWAREPVMKLQPPLLLDAHAHVLGYGAVARAVIDLLASVGMRVTVYRREAEGTDPNVDRFLAFRDLPREVGGADAVVGILPGIPETKHLVNRETLSAMKPSAVLINLGRGSLVDDDALIAALRSGGIAGAALDVFDQEPLPTESPLWTAPNLIISPHVAGQYRGASRNVMEKFLLEFQAFTQV